MCVEPSSPGLGRKPRGMAGATGICGIAKDHTSSQECVKQANKQHFTQKDKAIDGLPSTLAANTSRRLLIMLFTAGPR